MTLAMKKLVEDVPWLAELDEKEGFAGSGAAGSEGPADGGPGAEQGDDEPDEVEKTIFVMKTLDEVRAALEKQSVETQDDFRVTVMGGKGPV